MMRRRVSIIVGMLLTSFVATNCAFAEISQTTATQDSAMLKNVRDAARRVRSCALEVVNDVEQRKLAALPGDSLFLFPSQLKDRDPKVWLQEANDLGPIEYPRKSWLDSDVAHLDGWVKVLQVDVSALAASTPDSPEQFSAVMKDVQDHLQQLHSLSVGPKYDNLAIGQAAISIYDDMAKLEKPWQEAVKKKK